MENKQPLIVILGPTASGKTKLAVSLASKIDGEIISADSRQVYKGMTIGTGKDYDEYLPFFKKDVQSACGISGLHLVDIVQAGDNYNVAFFQRDFQKAYQSIIARQKIPILCGGTGMYIESILRNYEDTQVPVNQEFRSELEQKSDEELETVFQEKYKKTNPDADISTRKRLIRAIEIGAFKLQDARHEIGDRREAVVEKTNQTSNFNHQTSFIFGINIPTETRRERITKRLHERLENGMIDEVKTLLESGISAEKLIFYGLEYKFITEYLIGDLEYDEMAKRLETAIHQFGKRQMTFFRSMERKGLKINWLDGLQSADYLSNQMVLLMKNHRNDV
jgi:tRNA dimethylallyltransferase